MTVQLNVESRVDIKPGSSEQTLKKLGGESRNFGTAMREAAAEAKAAGGSISQSVQAVTREVQEAGRRQVNDARAAAQSKRGVERQAANERLEEIRRAAQQEIEAARVAANAVIAEAQRKAAAERQAAEAIRKAQVGQRMGMAQMGMQANDVATQLASGTDAAIVFAQQANQVGYAMTMMGGAAGRVGAIFAGPWGAAITAAVMGLSILSRNAGEAGGMADYLSDRFGEAGERVAVAFVDPVNDAIDSISDLMDRLGGRLVDGIMNDLDLAARALAWFKGQVDALIPAAGQSAISRGLKAALNPLGNLIDQGRNAAGWNGPERDRAAEREARRVDRAFAATAPSHQFNVSTGFDPFDKDKLRDFGRAVQEEVRTGEREAKKLADAAAREAKRAADAATREAKRVAEAHAKFLDQMELAAAKATSTDLFKPGLVDDYFKKQEQARKNDELSRVVGEADNRRAGAKEEAKVKADAFNKAMLGYATTIGDAIGNEAGRSAASVVGALISGDAGRLRGPGGNVARGLLDIAGTKEIKEAFRPLVAQMKTVFGDQPFGKELGKAFEAAGFGAGVAALIGKGSKEESIGGAIGAMGGQALGNAIAGPLGGAIGKIAGSIIGTAIGGLFVKPKTGSVTITGAGGEIGVSDAVGTGGSQKKNATAAGNSLSDALRQFAEQLGGTIGDFSVSIGQSGKNWRVDTSGAGRTNKKNAGVLAFGEDAEAAYAAALEDAIRDGAIGGVSPRVQAAIQRYADDVNRALSEAIKVQNLENWLADRKDPFAAAFREFERQAAERVRVARQYGFDVLEIEKANAEERAKLIKEQTEASLASVRQLLDDIRFGSRAEGSISDRLTALGSERSRLQGLVDGGDVTQIDALAAVLQQQLDLQKEAYGSTGQYASGRSETITTLEQLIKQTEDRVAAASSAAQNLTIDKLTELNGTADEQMTEMQRQTAALNQIIAQLANSGGSGGGLIGAFARFAV